MSRTEAIQYSETNSPVLTIDSPSDSKTIVSGHKNGNIKLWNFFSGKEINVPIKGNNGWVYMAQRFPLQGHYHGVNSLAFSADGTNIISGSHDKTIRIWDAVLGVQIGGLLQGHNDHVNSVAFSPDGSRAISEVLVAKSLKNMSDCVNSVAFSADGTIVSGSDDSTIRLWDSQTELEIEKPLEGHVYCVSSVAFSTDGTKIYCVKSVAFSPDDTKFLWDAETGAQIGEPLWGYTDIVKSVAFSPDGTWIVSGSDDKTIRIWDALSGSRVDNTRIISGSRKVVRALISITG
ncbi:WD40 repeat-like protein [Dendrothele bispora CBS 962.96]|uniref:WD40 repeat-like protein n=1 Tax=Dendrothele bispora (strain CBS 962.96) TaxID=1314807 RepID=A0A4V4HDI9_DENBC|nr:WD40 repeat-like protein [Dendrothele bispora CBS 962.96]